MPEDTPRDDSKTPPNRGAGPEIYLTPSQFEAVSPIVRDAVLKLWDVVEDLSKLRPSHSPTYQVTIFGSARIRPETQLYKDVRCLACELAKLGCSIVTGGGPGLMQAANEGAQEGSPEHPERSIGIRVDLEFEQAANAFVGEVYQHKTFFSRLHHFVMRSNAFVVVSGGIGTLLELAMVWQLLQVRKLYDTPLILVGPMWAELVDWASRNMVEQQTGLASSVDMTIPKCVDHVNGAIELLQEHHARWEQFGTEGADGVDPPPGVTASPEPKVGPRAD